MKIKRISENIYEIPREGKMNVPGRIFASEKIFELIKKDKTFEQVKNVACLPGILGYSIALPDAHQGYGFSIGGVAAFDLEKGVISPGGVGYDIDCSVRLLRTNLTKEEILKKQKQVVESLYRKIPSGVGRGSGFNLSKKDFFKVLEEGSKYIVEKGYGKKEDYINIEEEGFIKGADATKISERAVRRGIGQLGTLGAGNHFLEIQYVDKIFDEEVAEVFELKKDYATIMIHCGSRGLGHQIASDYIKKMEKEYGFEKLPDRELINAPINSSLGKDYLAAHNAAANFAFANKQLITYWVREELKKLFPEKKDLVVEVVYEVCHNIAKIEEYEINGKRKKVCVHRKGATRSFGPGRREVSEKYRKVGQPVLIPGSMGTSSYVLVGTKKAENLTWGSTVHGAGRVMSRSNAIKNISGEEVKEKLCCRGIEVMVGSLKGLSEEAPQVYKDVDEVVRVVDELGISRKVAQLKPLMVVKG